MATENYEMPEILSDWKSQSPTAFRYYEFHPHFSDIAAPGKNGRLLISSLASFITFTKLFEKEMKLIITSYLTFDDSIQEPLISSDWYFKKVEIFSRRVFQKCYPAKLSILKKCIDSLKIVTFIA